jgi:NAD(P)H-hydrate epimerase
VVLDADALNLLAAAPDLGKARRRDVVLTPHPGEAARLLGETNAGAVQADRVGAVAALANRHDGVVVLKGAGTLVASKGGAAYLVAEGNPGMATAGTGDVLAGMIGAFLARGLGPLRAAQLGAFAHALAGDRAAAEQGQEALIAGDLLAAIPATLVELAAQ